MAFVVKDEFRTNPQSLVPGGYDVMIFFNGKCPRIYKRVKVPYMFFQKAHEENDDVSGYKVLCESHT